MKILVTGYKGFIGSHAIEKLQSYSIPFITHEWNEQFPSLKDITHIMHFGAISSTTETNVEKVMHQNYDWSIYLLQLCNILNIQLQFSSSASIYGLGQSFIETAPPDPRTPYAWSKYLFERYVNSFNLNTTVQCFRYFNVYGDKGEEHKGDQSSPYFKFKKQALETGVIRIFENSNEYFRDFIHVDTLLETQIKFLNIPISDTWNIGTGYPKTFLEVANEVAEKYNAVIEYIPMPSQLSNSYQTYTCANLTKLNNTLQSAVNKGKQNV